MSSTVAEYERLLRVLTAPGLSMGLMLARFDDPLVGRALWDRARDEAQQRGVRVALIDLHDADDEADILALAAQASADAELLFIVGLEPLLLEFGVKPRASQAIAAFNFNRDQLPTRVAKPVVLWLSTRGAKAFALRARDTFDVIQTSFEFPAEPAATIEVARVPAWMQPAHIGDPERLEERLSQLVAQYEALVGEQAQQAGDRAAQVANIELSLRHYQSAAAWCGRAGSAYAAAEAHDNAAHQGYRQAWLLTHVGAYVEAEEALERAAPWASASAVFARTLELRLARAGLRQHQGRHGEALALAEGVRAEAEARGYEELSGEARAREAAIREASGELDKALALYRGQERKIEAKVRRWSGVKFDFKGMAKAVAKGLVDLGMGNWGGVAKDTVDLATSLGLTQTAAEQAGALLTRAMTRAVLQLMAPYEPKPKHELAAQLRGQLDALELELDVDFLARPRELPFVEEVRAQVEGWLEQVDLGGRRARTIAARLPSHFVYALHEEASRHDYNKLFAAIDTRFAAAWRDERSWLAYGDWVRRELNAPVFEEGFGLEQIFVWPRAYYVEGGEPRTARVDFRLPLPEGVDKPVHQLVWLHEQLDAWLERGAPNDCVRVISGDPGAGKSSFSRMYGARRMERGERVLIVPLHLLEPEADLSASLAALGRLAAPYPALELEHEPSLLLILDGLDELSKRGKLGARLADDFVQQLWRLVETRNMGATTPRLRVLLSGRPVAVADVAARFGRPGQVLHLVPYKLSPARLTEASWAGDEALIQLDQRHEWWANYAEHGGHSPEPPLALFDEVWIETTTQPLLAYLFVLVYRASDEAGEPIQPGVSRNAVYAQLLELVHARELDKREGGSPSQGKLSREEFGLLLEDMALAVWHDGGRVTTVAAVEALADPALVRDYCESTGGLRSLFLAFYLRRQGRDHEGEDTFEFTHKSFGEYLTARRLVAQLELTVEELDARAGSRRRRASKSNEELLQDWLEIFGPGTLTVDMLMFIDGELELRERGVVERWQRALIELLEHVLERGAICEQVPPGLSLPELEAHVRNAEEALLALLCCCAVRCQAVSEIRWPDEQAFARWMRRLIRRPLGVCTLASLRWLDISGQNIDYLDLARANFSNSVLCGVSARGANFEMSRFFKADLSRAKLNTANLAAAHLFAADLRDASLRAANLVSAFGVHANLVSAELERANLAGATFDKRGFLQAQIGGANTVGLSLI